MRPTPGFPQARLVGLLSIAAVTAGILSLAPAATARTGARSSAAATGAHVDFGSRKVSPPAGYTADYGVAYSASRGSGWQNAKTGAPLSLVGSGVTRTSTNVPDARYDSFMLMQTGNATRGVTAGAYAVALPNGAYTVTVGLGDPTNSGTSLYELSAQSGTANAVTIVDHVTPTKAHPFVTASASVTVSSGLLTLDSVGGTHVKLDYVDAVPATDTTAPTAAVSLAGTQSSDGSYTGAVTVTVNAADEQGGSGLASVVYTLDGGASSSYSGPFTVSSTGSHTVSVTATDNAGNVGTASSSWTETTPAQLAVSSPEDATLHLPGSRVVFSAIHGLGPSAPNQQVTFTNTGGSTLTVGGFAIGGDNPGSFALVGAPGSLSIAPGTSQTVSVGFTPSAPTNCPTSSSDVQTIGQVNQYGSLTFTTNDPSAVTSVDLAGIFACNAEGIYEPTLQQVVNALGYTTTTYAAGTTGASQRLLGPLRYRPGTDEITSPFFTAANPGLPVSLVPVAHYSGRNTAPSEATGYYQQGAATATPCNSSCKQLWTLAADTSTTYVQNQKLLPTPTGPTTFTPGGPFGLYSGDYSNVSYADDSLNPAVDTNQNLISPVHYLHNLRIFPAYAAGHVLIPNTYLVGIDVTRTPAYKNNDDQDVVLLLSNATPAAATAPSAGTAATSHDLTTGGTVSPSCAVTGFDGVLPNTAGTQCNAADIAFGSGGLTLTSTAGQLADSNQQNALYDSFDAAQNQFVVRARVVGPISQLAKNYQQIGAFFGPDQNNFVKVEAEHNGSGADPHLTMFYEENGTGSTVATVSVPALATAGMLDLIITGNADVPDPMAKAQDTNGVRGYPLDQLTVSYSLDGATPVLAGVIESPTSLSSWFSTSAKAGILVSNSSSTSPISATFSSFAITTS